MIDTAIELANLGHWGQKDKVGKPYILHPLRVMLSLEGQEKDVLIVAVLHDIVEDTDATLSDLKSRGFNQKIIDAIDAITRRKEETYSNYILRCKENKIAKIVKLADLEDNRNRCVKVLKDPTIPLEEKREFARLSIKYAKSMTKLEAL